MTRHTFTHRLNELYQPPSDEISLVEMPEMKYMMIEGAGSPEGSEFKAAIKWLFSLAYFIKPHIKAKLGSRFVEPPLECLFWADNEANFSLTSEENWRWRAMIVVLEDVTDALFEEVVTKVTEKLGPKPGTLRCEVYQEGLCCQTLHIGDYAEVKTACRALYNEFLPANNLRPNGRYHEIYLNDPERMAPEKRRIIIRQPVALR